MPPFREAFFLDLYFTLDDDSKPFDTRSVPHNFPILKSIFLDSIFWTEPFNTGFKFAFLVLYKAF